MFSQEKPPPLKYHTPKEPPPRQEDAQPFLVKFLPWLVVIVGLFAIATLLIFAKTDDRPWRCENRVVGQRSLTTFGTCTKE